MGIRAVDRVAEDGDQLHFGVERVRAARGERIDEILGRRLADCGPDTNLQANNDAAEAEKN
jgi:hypothetical protein